MKENLVRKAIECSLLLGFAWGLFSSCSQDGREPQKTNLEGEAVSLSLYAEVSVDDPEVRALNYKIGKNAKGDLVPLPQFTDGQLVDVHTIIKSDKGVAKAETLQWRYDLKKKKLVLDRSNGHKISIVGFNNDSSTKWYVSGLIGGELLPGATEVHFAGERTLRGVSGLANEDLGSLEVPYAFGWTELTIDKQSQRDSDGSYQYARVPSTTAVRFSPLGSLIAYKLGNAQTSGNYTFTPTGFIVYSNVWGDRGSFQLNTQIPSTNPGTVKPTWEDSPSSGTAIYTFASGHAPGAIAHNSTATKTYYAWVMPTSNQSTMTAKVQVMLRGVSSRPTSATYKDYTQTYFTDYAPKSSGTQGKVTQGKVHKLTAKATRRLVMPIEYVTENNLAGGEGFVSPLRGYTPQPESARGELRFATSHKNDASGYYVGYKILGVVNEELNPSGEVLSNATLKDTNGTLIPLNRKYFIPGADHWWGVFPSHLNRAWDTTNDLIGHSDYVALGVNGELVRRHYKSDYSKGFTSPRGGTHATSNSVIYAIRFNPARVSNSWAWDDDLSTGNRKTYDYATTLDNSMRCAYRFIRVGGKDAWDAVSIIDNREDKTHQLIVEAVYLGEETTPTTLAKISDDSWWETKKKAGFVVSKIFPAMGNALAQSEGDEVYHRNRESNYWTSSYHKDEYHPMARMVRLTSTDIQTRTATTLNSWLPVRLFHRNVE